MSSPTPLQYERMIECLERLDIDGVLTLAKKGVNLNTIFGSKTPLEAFIGKPKDVERLLNAGASPYQTSYQHPVFGLSTFLYQAIMGGHLETMRVLAQRHYKLLFHSDFLALAAKNGKLAELTILLEEFLPHAKLPDSSTTDILARVLFTAVENNQIDILKFTLQKVPDLTFYDHYRYGDGKSISLTEFAIQRDSHEILKVFIESGLLQTLNVLKWDKPESTRTAHYLKLISNPEFIQGTDLPWHLLETPDTLEGKAFIDALFTKIKLTAVKNPNLFEQILLSQKQFDRAEQILDAIPLEEKIPELNEPSLWVNLLNLYAADSENTPTDEQKRQQLFRIIQKMVAHGAVIDEKIFQILQSQKNPSISAQKMYRLEELTAQLGLSIPRATSLHLAAQENNLDFIRLLHGKGIDLNTTDQNGLRPIQYAAQSGQIEAMFLLIELGATAYPADWELLNAAARQCATHKAQLPHLSELPKSEYESLNYWGSSFYITQHQGDEKQTLDRHSNEFSELVSAAFASNNVQSIEKEINAHILSRKTKGLKPVVLPTNEEQFSAPQDIKQQIHFARFFKGQFADLSLKGWAFLSHCFAKKEGEDHQPLIAGSAEALGHLLEQMSQTPVGTEAIAIYACDEDIIHHTVVKITRTEDGLQVIQAEAAENPGFQSMTEKTVSLFRSQSKLHVHFSHLPGVVQRQQEGGLCRVFAYKDARTFLKTPIDTAEFLPDEFMKGTQTQKHIQTVKDRIDPQKTLNRAGHTFTQLYEKHKATGTKRDGTAAEQNQYIQNFEKKYGIWVASKVTQILDQAETPEQAKIQLETAVAKYDAGKISSEELTRRFQSSQKVETEQKLDSPSRKNRPS